MKVSHESPLCLLQESRTYNDYDYALIHLFKDYPQYKQFYLDSLKMGRTVYLDNSLFELEKMFNHQEFATQAEELGKVNPENFYYIIPDNCEDKDINIQSFIDFTKNYPVPGNKIGVVQGASIEDVLDCFRFMKERADVVALSFDYSFFRGEGNKYKNYMDGRHALVDFLKDNHYLDGVRVHLLGCGLPQEFRHYRGIKEIYSLDTSNPVVHGILGVKYTDSGLQDKLSIKLVELLETTDFNRDLVMYNINKFKEINFE